MATTVKIIDARVLPSLDPARRGKADRWVSYSTDGGRTGLVVVPEESATEDTVRRAIEADVRKAEAMIGRTFTL